MKSEFTEIRPFTEPCSDCRTTIGVIVKHTGEHVPPGTTGYFDWDCWIERALEKESREILGKKVNDPVRPLGVRSTLTDEMRAELKKH